MTRLVLALALVLTSGACGELGPFERIGEASGDWVTAATIPTTTAPAAVTGFGSEGLIGASDVIWANDAIGTADAIGEPQAVIDVVWDRHSNSRFIQASRSEIAMALPTIQCPESVPRDVRWVTSQLVFDPASGLLDPDTSVAFGFWTVEPYTVESGRVGVLRVGPAPDGVGAAKSDVVPIIVPDGLSLGWTDAGLRYEMFCNASVSEDMCRTIVESFAPLSELLPS